ncbi:hypothetical protein VHEMI09091 [[Torrubiella] hemipterigena]|uniref:Phosphoglycerate mutase family protein n=1 Tax=[Torrubiella] hemipterigena TaxID=1531966 RepID=A0A0A1TFE6_9HYPO|nr:hypothetical protein VHEMI09091 [[Torrubiella] hemipterigena]
MQLSTLIITASSIIASTAAANTAKADGPNFYLIRHAEKNPDGTISAAGLKREQCLITVFGESSKYNITRIMTQTPYPGDSQFDHETQRPFNTTLPLAQSLSITIDHPCNFTDTTCAGKAALRYSGPGNVLIAWEHEHLPAVAEAIGAKHAPKYPGSHFDLIYELVAPYTSVTVSSEDCPGYDKPSSGTTTAPSTVTTSSAAPSNTTAKTSSASNLKANVGILTTAASIVTMLFL